MWNVFKAQLRYFGWLLGITTVLYEALMMYFFVLENAIWFPTQSVWYLKFHHMVQFQLFFFLVYLLIFQGSRFVAKHDRIHASMPVNCRMLGFLRMVESLVAWVGIVAVFILHSIVFNHPCLVMITPAYVLTTTGWVIIMNAVYMIAVDIRYTAISGRTVLGKDAGSVLFFTVYGSWIVLWLASNSLMTRFESINALDPYYVTIKQFVFSGTGAAVVVAIGVVLSFAAVETFVRRRSYLA